MAPTMAIASRAWSPTSRSGTVRDNMISELTISRQLPTSPMPLKPSGSMVMMHMMMTASPNSGWTIITIASAVVINGRAGTVTLQLGTQPLPPIHPHTAHSDTAGAVPAPPAGGERISTPAPLAGGSAGVLR